MNNPGNLTGRFLQNLTVKVTHAQLRSGYSGWNRTLETPTFNRLYFIDRGEGKVIINGVTYYPRAGQLMIMPAGSTQTTETSMNDPYTRYFCHFDADIGEYSYSIRQTNCLSVMRPTQIPYGLFSQK